MCDLENLLAIRIAQAHVINAKTISWINELFSLYQLSFLIMYYKENAYLVNLRQNDGWDWLNKSQIFIMAKLDQRFYIVFGLHLSGPLEL